MKLNNSIVIIMSLLNIATSRATDLSQHDGGEYCGQKKINKIPHMCSIFSERSGYSVDMKDEESLVSPWQDPNMNTDEIRKLFPIFTHTMHGRPLVYFDSASTAQMPQPVLDEMIDYYESYKSNVGRGLYDFAERSTLAFEASRAKVARFIGAKKQEIVFTSGATSGINLVAHIWAQHHVHEGDEIIISEVEHNANLIPWQQLAIKKNAKLTIVPLGTDGLLDAAIFNSYLSNKTKLVAITHQSNILGIANDIKPIIDAAHAVGAKVLIDAAQSIAHQKINVKDLGCDFLSFSGHKLFGPTGVGALFLSKDIFDECVLSNFGGGMVLDVTYKHSDFKDFPHCLEPGTQPIAQVIGLGAAIDFIWKHVNMAQAQEHETALVCQLAQALEAIPAIKIISPIPTAGQHSNMVTFTSSTHHPYDIAAHLNENGIAVRAGYHCVQPYHDKLGGESSVRVSLSIYNTAEEIEFLVTCLKAFFAVAA